MPQGRRPIPLPLGGLSDNEGVSSQPVGTTPDAENVRSFDTSSGRRRLAQRPGSEKYVAEQVCTGLPRDIVPVTYDEDRVSYTQLTSSYPLEWSQTTKPGGSNLDVETDQQGNVYSLSPNGTVTKTNSAGVVVDTFRPSIPTGFVVVKRIQVDELDRVYVAASDATYGLVWQFRSVERTDGEAVYQAAWNVSTQVDMESHGIQDFYVRLGQLAVLTKGDPWQVRVWNGTLGAGDPLPGWTADAPTPSNRLVINSEGDVLLTAEPSDDRALGSADVGYGTQQIQWWFHEEFEASTRLHSLWVPDLMDNMVDGQRVTQVPDHRFVATTAENLNDPANDLQDGQPGGYDPDNANAYTPPTDDLPARFLQNREELLGTGSQGLRVLRPPVWRAQGMGTFAAIEFDASEAPTVEYTGVDPQTAGNSLTSRQNTSTLFKSGTGPDADGSNDQQRSVIPGHDVALYDTGGSLPGNGYTFFVNLEPDPAATDPMVVFSSLTSPGDGNQLKIALLYNVTESGGVFTPEAGTLCFYYYDDDLATTENYINIPASTWDPDGTAGNYICFVFTHGGVDTGGSARDDHCSIRVNGRACGKFTLEKTRTLQIVNFGGSWEKNRDDSGGSVTDGAIFSSTTFDAYTGKLGIGGCLLFSDQTAANEGPSVGYDLDTGWGPVQPTDDNTGDAVAATDDSGSVDHSDGSTGYGATDLTKQTFTKTATTVERIEGCCTHFYGKSDVLPNEASPTQDGTTLLWDAHPFGDTRVPFGTASGYNGGAPNIQTAINSIRGVVAKLSGANGSYIWATNEAGTGYGIVVDDTDNVVTVGPVEAGDDTTARRIVDNGTSFALTGAGTWTQERVAPSYKYPILKADSYGDIYYPEITASNVDAIVKLSKADGSEILAVELANETQRVQSVAFPPLLPAYPDGSPITGPEFLYIAATDGGVAADLLYKYRLVSQTLNVAEGRSLRRQGVVVVGDGGVKSIIEGTLATPTGGSGILTDSPYTWAVQLFGEVFINDGEKIVVYNPKLGTVVDFAPTDGGEAPQRARIMEAWRGRLILSRAADDPYEIYASELGNPYGWDRFPPVLSPTQAFSGRATDLGQMPDIVTAFIPLTDDLAIIGCDHSIFLLRGDPAAGGAVDTITDQVGIAYGRAWTMGPRGEVYAFTSRGGVIVMSGAGQFERLTVNSIERRMQDLDLERYGVRLAWDYANEGLWVLPYPLIEGGAPHPGWYWDAKAAAWWQDSWFSPDLQPAAVAVFDGDKVGDRAVLFACEDGYVRRVADVADDDGNAIDAHVRVGPISLVKEGYRAKVRRPQIVTAEELGGCDVQFRMSNTAGDPGPWTHQATVKAGLSPYLPIGASGVYLWMDLRNDLQGERVAWEEITAQVTLAGRSRGQ